MVPKRNSALERCFPRTFHSLHNFPVEVGVLFTSADPQPTGAPAAPWAAVAAAIMAEALYSPKQKLLFHRRSRSGQFGLTSAPMVPHFVHSIRGSNDFTVRSPDQ
jgi:hypothetical protein